MKEYVATSIISASSQRVWAVLADADAYRGWNPEIIGVESRMHLPMSGPLSPMILKSVGDRQLKRQAETS